MLVADAQAADKFADDALVGARSQAEAITKLRAQVDKARQLATAEVQKVVNFVGVHGDDIGPVGRKQVEAVQMGVQRAYDMLQQSEHVEDMERRALLEQAYAAYQQLQTAAAGAYQTAQADFQRLEQLRRELNNELAQARAALDAARNAVNQYRGLGGKTVTATAARIDVARKRFDRIRLPIRGEAQIKRTIAEAQAIETEAQTVLRELQTAISHEQQRRAGDFVTGMVVGSIVSGRSSNRGWGGSSHWGGGSSGGAGRSSGGAGEDQRIHMVSVSRFMAPCFGWFFGSARRQFRSRRHRAERCFFAAVGFLSLL
ncbi:MAG: hypothetical protein HC876_22615 [Chloroflexaceae bacterium]|nr:hypothetical protein [Chloroflexaceae bacterium]